MSVWGSLVSQGLGSLLCGLYGLDPDGWLVRSGCDTIE